MMWVLESTAKQASQRGKTALARMAMREHRRAMRKQTIIDEKLALRSEGGFVV